MIQKYNSPHTQAPNQAQNLNNHYGQDPVSNIENNLISSNSLHQPDQYHLQIQSYILEKQLATNEIHSSNSENKNQNSIFFTNPNMKKIDSEIISQYSNPVSPPYELTEGENLCSIQLSLNKSQRNEGKKLLNDRKRFNNYQESIKRQIYKDGIDKKQIGSNESLHVDSLDSDEQQKQQMGFIGRFYSAGNDSSEANKKRLQIKKCISSHGDITGMNKQIKNSQSERMKIKITQGQSGSEETPKGSINNKSQQKQLDLVEKMPQTLKIKTNLQFSQSLSESQMNIALVNNSKSDRDSSFKKKSSDSPQKLNSVGNNSYNSFFNVPSFVNIDHNSKIQQGALINKEQKTEKDKIKPTQQSPISLYSFRLNRNDESQIPASTNYENIVKSLENIEEENQQQSYSVITSNLNSMMNSNNLIKYDNLTMSQSEIGKKEEQKNLDQTNLIKTTKLDCLTNGSSRGPTQSLFNHNVQIKYIYNSNDQAQKQIGGNQRIRNMKMRKKNKGIQQYEHISSYQIKSTQLNKNISNQPLSLADGPNSSTLYSYERNNQLSNSLQYTPIKTEKSYSPDHPQNYIYLPEFNSAQYSKYQDHINYPHPGYTPSKNTIQQSLFSQNNNSKILHIKHLLPQTTNKKEQAFSYEYCHSQPKPSMHSLANTPKPRTNSKANRSVDIKDKIKDRDRRLRVTCVQSVDKKKDIGNYSAGGKINIGGILYKLDEYRRNNGIKLTETLIDSGHKVYYQSQYQYNQHSNLNTGNHKVIESHNLSNPVGCYQDKDNKIGKYVQLSKETKKNIKHEGCTKKCLNMLCKCRPCPEEDVSLIQNKPKRINLTSMNSQQIYNKESYEMHPHSTSWLN